MVYTKRKRTGLVWKVVIIAVIVFASTGYFVFKSHTDSNPPANNQENRQQNPDKNQEVKKEDASTGIIIATGDSKYGSMLFDNRGQAIYIWELEESTKAECYGDCAEEWPPVLTNGVPVASGSVKSELLGTTKRTDGTTQVTYNGHPLYFYAHEKAGEVKCHNISTHGGLWWVMQPSGVRAR